MKFRYDAKKKIIRILLFINHRIFNNFKILNIIIYKNNSWNGLI